MSQLSLEIVDMSELWAFIKNDPTNLLNAASNIKSNPKMESKMTDCKESESEFPLLEI